MMHFPRIHPLALSAAFVFLDCHAMRANAPTIDVLGSYFPAWMVCIILGLALTVVVRLVLIGLKLNSHLGAAAVVYFSMVILFTMAVWLVFYQN